MMTIIYLESILCNYTNMFTLDTLCTYGINITESLRSKYSSIDSINTACTT